MTKRKSQTTFGTRLRKRRLKSGYSLRKFADALGVSSTYLSQVEQGKYDPPTAERAARIAEIFGEDPDEWIGYAGRVPDDLEKLILNHPTDMPKLVRAAATLKPTQLTALLATANRLSRRP